MYVYIYLKELVEEMPYRVVLVRLDAVASDEGGFTGGVHQEQQSVGYPEGQSGNQHRPCWERPTSSLQGCAIPFLSGFVLFWMNLFLMYW